MKVKRFNKVCKRILIISTIVFIAGITYCNSLEATINVKVKDLQDDIEVLSGDIDGLNMEKDYLTNFQKIYDVALSNGYEYGASTDMAVAAKE